MNDEVLLSRVEKLEREVRRWRFFFALLVAVLVAVTFVPAAHAMESYLNVIGLVATRIDATTITASELTVQKRITIRDSAGKVRGTFGLSGLDEAKLELRTPDDSRSATLEVGRRDSSLHLWVGPNKPSARLWASTDNLLHAGISVSGGDGSSASLESTGTKPASSLTMSDDRGKDRVQLTLDEYGPGLKLRDTEERSRVQMSTSEAGGFGGFYSQFGSIEFKQNTKTRSTPEPILIIRGASSSEAAVLFGLENAEPVAGIKNSSGKVLWSDGAAKPSETPAPKKPKKGAPDPL